MKNIEVFLKKKKKKSDTLGRNRKLNEHGKPLLVEYRKKYCETQKNKD